MTLLRATSGLVLSLFLAHGGLSVAHADSQHGSAQSFARPQWKSPYLKGAPAIGTGPLLQLGAASHVTAAQYNDLSLAVQTLLTKFPADKHYFVGIGRDPAPIIAFLQNLGGKQLAVNFPASSNSAGSTRVDVLPTYVNKLIPAEALASGRTIVFVDVTSTGRALNHYVPLLTPLLKGAKVKRAAFAAPNWTNILQRPGENHVIDTTPFPDVPNYFGGIYENVVAEYPRHVPGASPITDLDNPLAGYTNYRNAVLQRMQRDEGLHRFLTTQGGSAFIPESPAEAAARVVAEKAEAEARTAAEKVAEEARVAKERSERAKELVHARAFPSEVQKTIEKLVSSLPARAEGPDKGPYLSDSAKLMNDWLKESVGAQAKVATMVPSVRRAGVNLVVGTFMDKVEQARAEKKIRNRDYRRLMGHAMSFADMNAEMVKSLTSRFENSKHFRREITEESEYFLGSHAEKARSETANMAANFKALVQHLPAAATSPAVPTSKE